MTELRTAVICAPLRTPVGRFGGALAAVHARTLAVTVLEALLERTGIDPAAVDASSDRRGTRRWSRRRSAGWRRWTPASP
ncbi:hypothetical protein [Agromyces sp. SYSU T00194]|uniref:thiolase family protein n=1 Tax=Agromyces chitinivorans TaxID=3158560 RepID=UPI003393C23B